MRVERLEVQLAGNQEDDGLDGGQAFEAINGLFQSAKRRARGFKRLSTIKTVIFLIAGKLDFQTFNPHARQPT
ncbi:hypothetical protein IXO367_15205 [Xanthomonas oryzae pv. oryzae]|nr:hypothetical protein IXO367_15205 [Xanthomonas oryzae pv. oryzae]